MYLKSLVLKGFKSFADRSEKALEQRTAIGESLPKWKPVFMAMDFELIAGDKTSVFVNDKGDLLEIVFCR